MKVAFRISIVMILLIASLYGLEKFYDFGLKHNQNIKLTNVATSPKNAELLIHGPCEPLWMISPAMLDPITGVSSYNLALSHSDFADNFLHLHLYLKTNRPPKYLLLYITPESFDINYNTFNSYRFAPYLDDSLVASVVKENDPKYYRWQRVPFMKYAFYNNRFNFEVLQGIKHFLTKRQKAYYDNGFEPPAKRVWGNHAGFFVKLYKENTVFKKNILREKYLVKTIRLAKENGIEVFLYESPVLEEAILYQPNRSEILQHIDSIAATEKVRFIKFENLLIAKDRSNYISTLNFNMKGLRIFNDTLAKFIRAKIINSR